MIQNLFFFIVIICSKIYEIYQVRNIYENDISILLIFLYSF